MISWVLAAVTFFQYCKGFLIVFSGISNWRLILGTSSTVQCLLISIWILIVVFNGSNVRGLEEVLKEVWLALRWWTDACGGIYYLKTFALISEYKLSKENGNKSAFQEFSFCLFYFFFILPCHFFSFNFITFSLPIFLFFSFHSVLIFHFHSVFLFHFSFSVILFSLPFHFHSVFLSFSFSHFH